MSNVQDFVSQVCRRESGAMVLFAELYERFVSQLSADELYSWSKIKFGQAIRKCGFPVGLHNANKTQIGNINWLDAAPSPGTEWVSHNNRLYRKRVTT